MVGFFFPPQLSSLVKKKKFAIIWFQVLGTFSVSTWLCPVITRLLFYPRNCSLAWLPSCQGTSPASSLTESCGPSVQTLPVRRGSHLCPKLSGVWFLGAHLSQQWVSCGHTHTQLWLQDLQPSWLQILFQGQDPLLGCKVLGPEVVLQRKNLGICPADEVDIPTDPSRKHKQVERLV